MNASTGKYFVKNTSAGTYVDMTTQFNGLAILKVDGLNEKGEPVNIYTAQWVNSQVEDVMITTLDQNNQPVVIRKNVDIEISFEFSPKYVSPTYTKVNNPSGNPKSLGYYEKYGWAYRPTWDTSVVNNKDYYIQTPATVTNILTLHDTFINYMTNGEVWIKSAYMGNKSTHCICLSNYKPTMVHVNRGDNSFITGTIKLHCIGDS